MIDVTGQGGLDKYSVMDDTEVKPQLTGIVKAACHTNTMLFHHVHLNLYIYRVRQNISRYILIYCLDICTYISYANISYTHDICKYIFIYPDRQIDLQIYICIYIYRSTQTQIGRQIDINRQSQISKQIDKSIKIQIGILHLHRDR